MYSETVEHSAILAYVEVPPKTLSNAITAVQNQLQIVAAHTEVDFNEGWKRNIYSGKVAALLNAIEKGGNDLRKYKILFTHQYSAKDKYRASAYIELTVRVSAPDKGSAYPRINVYGRGCDKDTFLAFVDLGSV